MVTEIPDFNIRHLNTFRMNVKCGKLIEYTDKSDLPGIISGIGDGKFLHIGSGSNLLFTGDCDITLLHSRILDVEYRNEGGEVMVRAGAGVVMDELIEQTCAAGLWGLENLSGIPGEAGASAVQNVGAYGVEAKDVIDNVECYDTLTGKFVTFQVGECSYGYRSSMFKSPEHKGRYIVTYVTYRLSSTPKPILSYGHVCSRINQDEPLTPMTMRNIIINMRNEKLPDVNRVGSAGSFFKNPVVSDDAFQRFMSDVSGKYPELPEPPHYRQGENIKLSAAWLIDKAGLKGTECGGAAVWHTQPLVIVNNSGNATPDDVLKLESQIIDKVKDKFGIVLSPEVEHI